MEVIDSGSYKKFEEMFYNVFNYSKYKRKIDLDMKDINGFDVNQVKSITTFIGMHNGLIELKDIFNSGSKI